MSYTLLQSIAKNNEDANTSPLSTIEDTANSITYVINGAISVGGVAGYKVQKITAVTANTIIQSGFLPESLRRSGANGSGANVSISSDIANTILLLNDSSISFG